MLDNATNLSFSRIGLLTTCSQKYHHKYVAFSERLEPVGDYMRIGKVVDMCLLYAKGAEGMAFDSMLRANDLDFFVKEDQPPKEIFLDEKWYHYCAGLWEGRERIYDEMFKEYPDVDLQSFLEITLMDRESGECITDDSGREIPWVQYLDAWSAFLNTIIEIKTYSGNLEQTFLEHQFVGQTQINAFSKMLQTGTIPKCRYYYIKKPALRQKKDETAEEFHERMFDAGLNAPIEIKDVQYREEELNETMKYYYDLVKVNLHSDPYKDRRACYQWGRPCEYLGHCWKYQVRQKAGEEAA